PRIFAPAQAEPLQAKDELLQASTYEADAQEQRGAENQDFTVSFAGNASSSLRASGKRHQHCRARSHFGRRRQADCLSSGVQDQPRQHDETCLYKKNTKIS
uniref:Alpha-defensin N-terminal domain-containing protein n=1 Tax=Piliocolobus tephrosceles TaxID=591936 RepID=A0A8C9H553_9PRIM